MGPTESDHRSKMKFWERNYFHKGTKTEFWDHYTYSNSILSTISDGLSYL